MDSLVVRAFKDGPWKDSVGLYILEPGHLGIGKRFAADFDMVDLPVGTKPQAVCNLSDNACQSLMNDLWDAGFRPSEGSGSAGALLATQAHLADLRTLLFHETGISKSP